jgi:LPS sulfotransferase NodH
MLHVGRCGSTVLAEMLGRHPSVSWDGEVFEPVVRAMIGAEEAAPEDFLRTRASQADGVYGFEIKYLPSHHQRQLHVDLPEMIEMCDRVGVTHYVTLHRQNYLRRVVSGAIGRQRGTWHRSAGAPARPTAIHLDPDNVPFGPDKPLLTVFAEMKTGEQELRAVLRDKALLEITYEDDIESNPVTAYSAVCRFLGVEPEEAHPSLSRTGDASLAAMVTNYQEIADLLDSTEYAWMLDQP